MSKIEIRAVGGYNEVGRNMTAVRINDEVFLLDMGVYLENYIKLTEDEDLINIKPSELIRANAAPSIRHIKDWQSKVRAIIPTHAHLDHIGAIPFLANKFDAEILGTPYTISVLQTILREEGIEVHNPIKTLNSNSIYTINNVKIELIHMTHSVPQTAMIAIHTPKGIILYANDFKFDNYPVLGKKPNYKRLEELGKKGVLALIVDSTYSREHKKTPSESVAREMLRDVMLGTNADGKAIIVTTFSSHLARIKSIVEFGKKLNRKIVFLGRSLSKYTYAGEDIDIVSFSKDVEIIKYSSKIKKTLKKIMADGKEKYLLVVTGHQGEPQSTLSKMVNEKMGFRFDSEDHVIFSCKTIPTKTNFKNREKLEKDLKKYGVRIFNDIHVSGHAAREDIRDLINMVKPKNIIPAHGYEDMRKGVADLAIDMGYNKKNIHLLKNGERVKF